LITSLPLSPFPSHVENPAKGGGEEEIKGVRYGKGILSGSRPLEIREISSILLSVHSIDFLSSLVNDLIMSMSQKRSINPRAK